MMRFMHSMKLVHFTHIIFTYPLIAKAAIISIISPALLMEIRHLLCKKRGHVKKQTRLN